MAQRHHGGATDDEVVAQPLEPPRRSLAQSLEGASHPDRQPSRIALIAGVALTEAGVEG
jgi:hypothetical protein